MPNPYRTPTWSELLPYLEPGELTVALGPRGRTLLKRLVSSRPNVLMHDAGLDELIVEVLETIHGDDPLVLVVELIRERRAVRGYARTRASR